MTKALVVFSGGQDSTVCLYWALQQFDEVTALSIDYGQHHDRELQAAERICQMAGVAHEVVQVGDCLKSTSPLTQGGAELETYSSFEEMEKVIGDRVEKTFVPMRNALFLTIAANHAIAAGADNLVTGVCQEDNANYPDCRAVFIRSVSIMIGMATNLDLEIHTPLMNLSKAETVKLSLTLPGCYEALAYSHTAYSGEYPPRTQDHSTVLREQGFSDAGVPDPLLCRALYEGCDGWELPNKDHYRLAAQLGDLGDLVKAVGAA